MRKRKGLRAQQRDYNAITAAMKAESRGNRAPKCGCPVNAPEADTSLWPCPCGDHCAECKSGVPHRGRTPNPSAFLDEVVGPEASKALEEYYGNDVRRVFQAPREELERLMLGKKRLTKKQVEQILLGGKAIGDHLGAFATQVTREKVWGPQAIRDYFMKTTDSLELEEVWVVACDTKLRPYQKIFVSRGTLDASLVHPREFFTHLIRGRAYAFFMVHNHPSGDPHPSQADINITKRLKEVAEVVGIRFLDHIIIGIGGNYVSLTERGLM